jgi:hypothetical protein
MHSFVQLFPICSDHGPDVEMTDPGKCISDHDDFSNPNQATAIINLLRSDAQAFVAKIHNNWSHLVETRWADRAVSRRTRPHASRRPVTHLADVTYVT